MSSYSVQIILQLRDQLTGPAKVASQSFAQMGTSMQRSASQISAGSAQAARSLNQVSAAATTAEGRLSRVARNMRNLRTVGRGLSTHGGFGSLLTLPLANAIRQYATFEDKLLDLKKVFPGTTEEYHETVKSLVDLSRTVPLAREEIVKLAEEASKAGVVKPESTTKAKEFSDYTRIAAEFAVAFGLSIDASAETLGRLKSALDLSIPDLRAFGDEMNYIANNSAATEAGILEIVRRAGSLGKAIGGTQGVRSVTAIGSAQLAAGVRQDVAATGLRTLLIRLQQAAGVQMSSEELDEMGFDEKEIKNLQKGLKTTKNALKLLNLDPADIAKGLSADMAGTIKTILQRIADLSPDQQGGVLAALGGMRATDALVPLLANLNLLDESLRLINDESRKGSMNKEYLERVKGLNAHLQILSNTIKNLVDSGFEPWAQSFKDFTISLSEISKNWEGSGIVKWGFAMLAVMAVASAIILPLGLMAMALSAIAPFAIAAARGFGVIASVVKSVAVGAVAGAASLARISTWAYRLAGAAGVATLAFRALRRVLLLGVAIEGITMLYDNWSKLKELLADPLKVDIIFPEAPSWLKWLMRSGAEGINRGNEAGLMAQNQVQSIKDWFASLWPWGSKAETVQKKLLQRRGRKVSDLGDTTAAEDIGREATAEKIKIEGSAGAPKGIEVVTKGPNVTFNQAPPAVNVSVTVNAMTNADPGAIGAAAGNAVGSAVRGALSDGAATGGP